MEYTTRMVSAAFTSVSPGPQWQVFPNPAFDEVHLSVGSLVNGPVRVQLYHLLGQPTGRHQFSSLDDLESQSIPLPETSKGDYLIEITFREQKAMKWLLWLFHKYLMQTCIRAGLIRSLVLLIVDIFILPLYCSKRFNRLHVKSL
jgi:hypothetical protein